MDNLFLTVVTRHVVGREALFSRCKDSLSRQSVPSWEQVVIHDPIGQGLAFANKILVTVRGKISGEYVYILDDDNYLVDDAFIYSLMEVALTEHFPDIIMVRAHRIPYNEILPDDAHWGQSPTMGNVDSLCFVVRREVWERHIHKFSVPILGDITFIKYLFKLSCSVAWLDKVVAEIDQIGHWIK